MSETIKQIPFGEWKREEADVVSNNAIEIVPLELTNTEAFAVASAGRMESDYTPENLEINPYIPPPNLARGLLLPKPSIDNLQATVQKEGIRNFKLMIVRHIIPTKVSEFLSVPMDTVGSFQYAADDGTVINVAGNPMVSQLHRLVATTMTGDERAEVIEHHFGQYLRDLPNHDVTVISIPPRKDNAESPTHQAFMSFEGVYYEPKVNEEGKVKGNLYYFPHGEGEQRNANIAKIQKLRSATGFHQQANAISTAWNQNFQFVLQQPDNPKQDALGSRQTESMSALLINAYNLQK